MMGHTPGPWIWSGAQLLTKREYHSDTVLVSYEAVVEPSNEDKVLIAAAPDLLAALKALDDHWLPEFPEGPTDGSEPASSFLRAVKAELAPDTVAVWRQVRDAIAKATQP